VRVLVACEFSGIVREAFRAKGHDAWSCDLEDSEIPSKFHHKGDVLKVLDDAWDLMIAHPPCTHTALTGARWFKDKKDKQLGALVFASKLWKARIPKICLENPYSILSTYIGKANQVIQPFQFGDPYRKRTCLWLKGLPLLKRTHIETDGESKSHNMPDTKDQAKNRSRTYPGIAQAMAEQWQ
jgi:hypothetical protein